MEDQTKKGSNVVIEVKSKSTNTAINEEVEAEKEFKETIEVINADQLSPEEIEELSDDAISEVIEENTQLGENPSKLAGEAMSLLGKFKEYIGTDRFDEACQNAADRNGVDKAIIKNAFVKNALGTIANALNLTVHITGEIIKGAVSFIDTIIATVVNFSTSTLHKLVTVLTLNCGSVQY